MKELALLLIAAGPWAPWWWARFPEEPCALLLLPLLLGLRPQAADLRPVAAVLTLEALLSPWAPNLLRAALGMSALACLLSSWRAGRPFYLPIWGLCLLSLPGISSSQFFLGYPLRWLATQGSAALLKAANLPVQTEGLGLRYGQQLVLVDAPCSGLKMAWFGMAVLLMVAAQRAWSTRQTLNWCLLALMLTLLTNCWRGAALFLLAIHHGPQGLHEPAGLLAFGFSLLLLVRLSPGEQPQPRPQLTTTKGLPALALAALLNLIPGPLQTQPGQQAPQWPTQFEGKPLRTLPTTPEEKRYYQDFPGAMRRFSDGQSEIILRQITRPTRRLHSASECFRSLGYSIEEQGLWRDSAGNYWHRFLAKGAQQLQLRERIYNENRSWTDLSEWYWTAGQGPWWSVCVASSAGSQSK